MGSYNETADQFYDLSEEFSSVCDLRSDCSDECSISGLSNYASDGDFGYDFWTKGPGSVDERRNRLFKWMGLTPDCHQTPREDFENESSAEIGLALDRIKEKSEAVLANSDCEDNFFSSHSFGSCRSDESIEPSSNVSEENHICKIKNLDDGTEFIIDELDKDGTLSRLRETGSNRLITFEEFQNTVGSSSMVQRLLRREAEIDNMVKKRKKSNRGWLKKLGVSCAADVQEVSGLKHGDGGSKIGVGTQRHRVNSSRKRYKELSALYVEQEFRAHEGAILVMKFSPDGQYLASAGEDGVVRVWKVIEDERPNKFDISNSDTSCLYFSLNHLSKLSSFHEKENIGKMQRLKRSSESACVIFPPKIFRILENPVHEFHGHSGEVLALSWSKKGDLISSSADKTVRLWQVGTDNCIKVFSHNNYVTCVEFNPADDNYFISGSIDGKVRIWDVHRCRVVDWIDVREIVTAVCYCPSGKGGIVGSMDGNCLFYEVIDNRLQLGAQIGLQGKKKFPGKRITGFQFSPSDPTKVMVSSADSQIRILFGADVICKFKGNRSSGTQESATFTADGKHIVMATLDSNVYVWNYNNPDMTSSQAKSIRSHESFLSQNASIAIPWFDMTSMSQMLNSSAYRGDTLAGSILGNGHFDQQLGLSSSDCFSLGRGFFLEYLHRESATWPEEKLPNSSTMMGSPPISKSEYKVLKSACHSTFNSPHMWGLVIVTATWDGCIRTYLNYGLPIHL